MSQTAFQCLAVLTVLSIAKAFAAVGSPTPQVTLEEYIRKSTVPKEILDQWLKGPSWVTFDHELGYVLGNSLMPWCIDNSATIETIQKTVGDI